MDRPLPVLDCYRRIYLPIFRVLLSEAKLKALERSKEGMPITMQTKTEGKADPIDPVAPQERHESAPRRWLAWFAIPVAVMIVWFAETGVHDRWLADSVEGAFLVFGMLAGAACIVFSRPQLRGLKWVLLVLYVLVIVPIIALIEIMVKGIFDGRSL